MVTRPISRRTGSKHEMVTHSGVSSMMRLVPVSCSNERMLRPSRPMMRPFRSSEGIWMVDTVFSAEWSAATRWMARLRIMRDFLSASAFARASASRMMAADSCATSSLQAVEQFGLRLVRRHAGHALEATAAPPSRRRPRGHARGARSAPAWTRSDALAHRATRHGGRATPRVEKRGSRRRALRAAAPCSRPRPPACSFRAWSFASMSASRRNVSACRFASATTLSASCAARFVDALTKNRAMTKPRATPTTAPMTSHNASGIRSPFHDGCSVKQ